MDSEEHGGSRCGARDAGAGVVCDRRGAAREPVCEHLRDGAARVDRRGYREDDSATV